MRQFDHRVEKEYKCYEFKDRLYNIGLEWTGVKTSIPDRNDRGEVNFIRWSIDPMSIIIKEVLDSGEEKDVEDSVLIDEIIDGLEEPEGDDLNG